jgi:hypothetical protein
MLRPLQHSERHERVFIKALHLKLMSYRAESDYQLICRLLLPKFRFTHLTLQHLARQFLLLNRNRYLFIPTDHRNEHVAPDLTEHDLIPKLRAQHLADFARERDHVAVAKQSDRSNA